MYQYLSLCGAATKEVPLDTTTLTGQIDHKLSFLRDHVPEGVKVVLVGHSIGCYMILSLLRALPRARVPLALMLMPTIERMAESPQGRKVAPLLRHARWILPFLLLFVFILSAAACPCGTLVGHVDSYSLWILHCPTRLRGTCHATAPRHTGGETSGVPSTDGDEDCGRGGRCDHRCQH